MALKDQMEIDEIDALLGEDEPRKRRVESPMPRVSPMPQIGSPDRSNPIGAPEAFSREPSDSLDVVDVGARGGAHTTETPSPTPTLVPSLTPPTGALAPRPPAPTSAPDVGTGITSPRSTGAGATNPQDAYNNFTGMVDPNASQGDMESAIESAFGHLPGYGGAYKESVMLNGKWYDLVGGYGGPNASFHGLMEKKGGKGSFSAGLFPEGGGVPQIDNESRLDAILASIDAMARGEGGPLVTQSIDELLGGGAVATPEAVTPMVDQSPMRRSRGGNARAVLGGV